jgi:hypothetical protein
MAERKGILDSRITGRFAGKTASRQAVDELKRLKKSRLRY